MDTFAEIADERRELADLVSGLTPEQLATQSLCGEWTVHEVVGHLVVPLEVGIPGFLLAMLASRGSFDADDIDWSQGRGPVVRGSAEALLLAVTGRRAALADLGGEGVPTLRDRLGSTS